MRKVREIYRLHHEVGLSARAIARALNMTHTAVNSYLKRFADAMLDTETIHSLADSELQQRLFPPLPEASVYPIPDWTWIHSELRKQGVTLQTLHEEYAKEHPKGHYGYTWFTRQYRTFAKKLTLSMKQHHKAGEKVFVDFSGMTMPIVNPLSGEVTQAEIFVGVLGASDYPFALAVPSQKKRDFYEAHVQMFEYFGGVPELIIPDNLRSGVLKADRYDPDLNTDYQALATHYGCAIFPARPYKPKDKAKVDVAKRNSAAKRGQMG